MLAYHGSIYNLFELTLIDSHSKSESKHTKKMKEFLCMAHFLKTDDKFIQMIHDQSSNVTLLNNNRSLTEISSLR